MVIAQSISYKIKGQRPKSIYSEVFLVTNGENGVIVIGNSIIKGGIFEFKRSITVVRYSKPHITET